MKYRIGAIVDEKQLPKVAEILGSSGFSCLPVLVGVSRDIGMGRRGKKSKVGPLILEALSSGPKHVSEIRQMVNDAGFSGSAFDAQCTKLKREGLIASDGDGLWFLLGQDDLDQAQLPS